MSSFDTTTSRFLRPADLTRVRRNQRRIQVQRVLAIARGALVVAALVVIAVWAWRQTQSDARFAVRAIAVEGAVHTPRTALAAITDRYRGQNLFRLDIAGVQREIGRLPWVSRIDIEKQLPDTLRVRIVERRPVALVQRRGRLEYVDESGLPFAELSPAVGDDDLPLIVAGGGEEGRAELARSVALLRELRSHDPAVYSRISEVRPIAPRGFALFDRELGACVYANADDLSAKWRSLYAIVRAERLPRAAIEYADLRFTDRVIVKPVHPITTAAAPAQGAPVAPITN